MKLIVIAALVAVACAAPQNFGPNRVPQIIRYEQQQDPAGFYTFRFETENGIAVQEEGTVIRPGTNDESTAKRGSYSYTGPDGVVYTVNYIADDDGFRASGEHLPTPPPIPAEILRSLQENGEARR